VDEKSKTPKHTPRMARSGQAALRARVTTGRNII
jgi:hypothetical protein